MSGTRAKKMRAAAGAVMMGEPEIMAPGTAKQLRRAARVLTAGSEAPNWAQPVIGAQPTVVDPETMRVLTKEEVTKLLKQQEQKPRWPRGRR